MVKTGTPVLVSINAMGVVDPLTTPIVDIDHRNRMRLTRPRPGKTDTQISSGSKLRNG